MNFALVFHLKMNMLKQETQKQNKENQQFKDRGTNEKYILYFNLNGRKKDRASNIKLARQITMLKNVQITTAKTRFLTFPMTHKHDVSENLAPLAYIYCITYNI